MFRQLLLFLAIFIVLLSFSCEGDNKIKLEDEEEYPIPTNQESILSKKPPLSVVHLDDSNFEKTFVDSKDEYLLIV